MRVSDATLQEEKIYPQDYYLIYKPLCRCLALVALLSGCATTDYKTHYGIFKAETSDGTIRDFRVYWQSIRHEGWTENVYRVTPITMETQCSERKIFFYDPSHGRARKCESPNSNGIVSCGEAGRDFDPKGMRITAPSYCGYITDDDGNQRISDLTETVLITFECRPYATEVRKGAVMKNVDYIRASSVPYTITTKTIRGQSVEKLVPPLNNHPNICDK